MLKIVRRNGQASYYEYVAHKDGPRILIRGPTVLRCMQCVAFG